SIAALAWPPTGRARTQTDRPSPVSSTRSTRALGWASTAMRMSGVKGARNGVRLLRRPWRGLRRGEVVARVPHSFRLSQPRQIATVVQSQRRLQSVVIQVDVGIIDVAAVHVIGRILAWVRNAAGRRVHLAIKVANPGQVVVAIWTRT